MCDGVRLQREIAGGRRGRQRDAVRREIRAERAAARALVAALAWPASIVLARQHRGGAADELALAPELRRHASADVLLERVHLERRLQDLLGQLREARVLAARADEALHVFVPGLDVRVADRPVDADALAQVRLEVEIAEAEYVARPHERASADVITAIPVERLRLSVGLLQVVDEMMLGGLVV